MSSIKGSKRHKNLRRSAGEGTQQKREKKKLGTVKKGKEKRKKGAG